MAWSSIIMYVCTRVRVVAEFVIPILPSKYIRLCHCVFCFGIYVHINAYVHTRSQSCRPSTFVSAIVFCFDKFYHLFVIENRSRCYHSSTLISVVCWCCFVFYHIFERKKSVKMLPCRYTRLCRCVDFYALLPVHTFMLYYVCIRLCFIMCAYVYALLRVHTFVLYYVCICLCFTTCAYVYALLRLHTFMLYFVCTSLCLVIILLVYCWLSYDLYTVSYHITCILLVII
jgi:hypothetical protein